MSIEEWHDEIKGIRNDIDKVLAELKKRISSDAYKERHYIYRIIIKSIERKFIIRVLTVRPADLSFIVRDQMEELGRLYAIRGNINFYMGKNEALYEDCIKSLAHEQHEAFAYQGLALYYMTAKSYDKALENIDRASELNPNDYEHHLIKGIINYWLNDFQGAFRHLARSVRIDPNLYISQEWLGIVYTELKRWEDAEAAFIKCFELEPDNVNVIGRLNDIRRNCVVA
jgi:tetratricopeptide (TPR) repeat protein